MSSIMLIIIVINYSLIDIGVLLMHLPCADRHHFNLILIRSVCCGGRGSIMIPLYFLNEETKIQKVKVVCPRSQTRHIQD